MDESRITRAAFEKYGYGSQLLKAIEESAEMQVELAKCHAQFTTTGTMNLADLCSKIADVKIVIAQLELMTVEKDGVEVRVCDLVKLAEKYKLKRLAERIGCDDRREA